MLGIRLCHAVVRHENIVYLKSRGIYSFGKFIHRRINKKDRFLATSLRIRAIFVPLVINLRQIEGNEVRALISRHFQPVYNGLYAVINGYLVTVFIIISGIKCL